LEPHWIDTLPAKRLVGMSVEMSLSNNRTAELWRGFMPRRQSVSNRIGNHYFSLQKYLEPGPPKPDTVFEKWAAVEVSDFDTVPSGMEPYELEGGDYAVFVHRGPASTFPQTMSSIFQDWLPSSGFQVDSREHFELLEDGYSPIDPMATEEVWIPIR